MNRALPAIIHYLTAWPKIQIALGLLLIVAFLRG